MIKKLILLIFVVIFSISIYAQSIFSFEGPSEMFYSKDIFAEGMGGTGSGDLFRRNTSFINPSLSTTFNRTNFSTAFMMGKVTYDDGSGTFKDDQAYLPYFNIIVPVKQHRFIFHYNTISTGKLNTETEKTVLFDNDEEFTLTEEQKISFSLYRTSAFYANSNDVLNFGFGLSYLFGHRILYFKQDYTSTELYDVRFENEALFKNPTLNFGVSKLLDNFSFGLAGSLPVKLKGNQYFKTNTLNEKISNYTYEYPATLNLGITYKPSELFTVSTDIDFENWAKTNSFDNAENSNRLALGLSWDAYRNNENFLKNIPIRFGLSHRNLPFKVNNSTVNEFAYHYGLSIPLKQYDSYLDLALKVYTRGDLSKHNYEENGFLLSIGTQGFDFIRKPLDRRTAREIPKPDKRGNF